MKHSIKRPDSLPLKVADRIAMEISAHTWNHTLPGTRALAVRYNVSRKTTLAAIQLLESRGLLQPPEPGKRRRIRRTKSTPLHQNDPRKGCLLILHDQVQAQSARHESNLHICRSLWMESGENVIVHQVDYEKHTKPQTLLAELAEKYRASAFVLLIPQLVWIEAASQLLPTYSMGGNWTPGYNLASAHGYRISDQIAQLISHLHSKGHQRILIPNYRGGQRTNTILLAVQQGIEKFITNSNTQNDLHIETPLCDSQDPHQWFKFWKDALRKHEPTAVITSGDLYMQSLYGFCAASKISIPNDLSIVCMEYSTRSNWMWPVPTMLRHSDSTVKRQFRKWITGGLRPTSMKYLQLELIEGNSVKEIPQSP